MSPPLACSQRERKALFLVRDFAGDPTRVDDTSKAPNGDRVEVTFRDDEVMLGSTQNYSAESQGSSFNRLIRVRTISACSSLPRACSKCVSYRQSGIERIVRNAAVAD
jgi:hypothetical protein